MPTICRTCLMDITYNTSIVMDSEIHYKYKLLQCVPELDIRILPDTKMCKDCYIALNIMYKLKITCRAVEDKIDKYLQELSGFDRCLPFTLITDNRAVVKRDPDLINSNICRLCQSDSRLISLYNKLWCKYTLMRCIPEMYLQTKSDTKLCRNCKEALNISSKFKSKCIKLEKNINNYLKEHKDFDLKDLIAKCNMFDEVIVKQEEMYLEDDNFEKNTLEEVMSCNCVGRMYKCDVCILKSNIKSKFKCILSGALKRSISSDLKIFDSSQHNQVTQKNDDIDLKISKCDVSHKPKSKNKKKEHSPKQKSIVKNCKRLYKCSLCNYSTEERKNFRYHILRHEKPFKCPHCTYSAVTKSHLKSHLVVHSSEKPFKCSQCFFSTKQKLNLKQHLSMHSGVKPFKCLHCKYRARKKVQLRNHLLTHTTDSTLFKCSVCSYSTKWKSRLKNHFEIRHTEMRNEKSFKCAQCDYKTIWKSCLMNHSVVHTSEKLFQCLHCNFCFKRKTHLRRHLKIHSGEKPFNCSFCDFKTLYKAELKIHIYKHTLEESFKSLDSEYNEKQKSQLKNIQNAEVLKCTQCDFSTIRMSYLRTHILKHTGEKPFKCSYCDYKTSSSPNLYKHARSHADEKPFKCLHCSFATKYRSSLRNHSRQHADKVSFKSSTTRKLGVKN